MSNGLFVLSLKRESYTQTHVAQLENDDPKAASLDNFMYQAELLSSPSLYRFFTFLGFEWRRVFRFVRRLLFF